MEVMIRALRLPRCALFVSVLLAAEAFLAPARAAWTAKGSGPGLHVEGRSQKPGGLLWLSCSDGVKLYLYPPPGWDGRRLDPTYVTIDGHRTTTSVDGVDRGVVLSDRPHDAIGITSSLLNRIKGGKTLVISGAPATKVSPAQLTFPLAGAASAIARFERGCAAAGRLK